MRVIHRSDVTKEIQLLPVVVQYQLERFDDGTEEHTFRHPHLGIFSGPSRDEAIDKMYARARQG